MRMRSTYRYNAIATASFLVPRSFSDLGRCLDVVSQLVVIPKVEWATVYMDFCKTWSFERSGPEQ